MLYPAPTGLVFHLINDQNAYKPNTIYYNNIIIEWFYGQGETLRVLPCDIDRIIAQWPC